MWITPQTTKETGKTTNNKASSPAQAMLQIIPLEETIQKRGLASQHPVLTWAIEFPKTHASQLRHPVQNEAAALLSFFVAVLDEIYTLIPFTQVAEIRRSNTSYSALLPVSDLPGGTCPTYC